MYMYKEIMIRHLDCCYH